MITLYPMKPTNRHKLKCRIRSPIAFYERFGSNGYDYAGEYAIKHTAKQCKIMREKGINILSFFISGE